MMERRGFLEKFAKSAAGLALSAGDIVKDITEERREFRYHLPRIVKIYDETVCKGGNADFGVLNAMLKVGLKNFYADTDERDIIPSLFPGLVEGAMTGFFLYGDNMSEVEGAAVKALIEVLQESNRREGCLTDESILIWAAGEEYLERSGIPQLGKYRIGRGVDYPIDAETDTSLDLGGLKIFPSPILSRVCQFQVGLVEAGGDNTRKNLCRDMFMHCFVEPGGMDWLEGVSEEEKWTIYERISYPQGMKFRLFCAERLKEDGVIYLSGDGVYLDKFLAGGVDEKLGKTVELVEIVNPSAPVVKGIRIKRQGEDNVISWADEGYDGFYQIYDGKLGYPAKKMILGVTKNRSFTDSCGAGKGRSYIVTKAWGK